MLLAKVVGTVVATRKEPSLDGLKLLLVRPLDEEGREIGAHLVAADAVGAGPDEIVLVAHGKGLDWFCEVEVGGWPVDEGRAS